MRKIEENQLKQVQSGAEKTYIIDDIDEDLIYVAPIGAAANGTNQFGNIAEKTYIKGDRRVTTVVEQQTWEDLEDDYDEDQNEVNIVKQYEQMKSNSSAGKTLQSYENSMNNSPVLQLIRDREDLSGSGMIQSSEFRIEMKSTEEECSRISFYQIEECKDEDDDQENLIDENEELVQSEDFRSYEQVACSQTFRSNISSVAPISMIDLSASMNSHAESSRRT